MNKDSFGVQIASQDITRKEINKAQDASIIVVILLQIVQCALQMDRDVLSALWDTLLALMA